MTAFRVAIFRKITKRFVIISNIILGIFFLLSCLSFYANPIQYWYIALLGLAFPYLLLLTILFLIGWLFFKSKWSLLNVCLLLIGWQNINAVFAFNAFSKKFTVSKKDTSTVRVIQWNTLSFGEYEKDRIWGTEMREKMFEYIKKQDADVLCFQEFFDAYHKEFNQNINYLKAMGYPNVYFARDYNKVGVTRDSGTKYIGYWGSVIFTKLPIVDSGKIVLPDKSPEIAQSLCYVDMMKQNQKIRVYTTHLQSIRLGKSEYEEIDKLKSGTETDITKSRGIFSKISKAYNYRKKQADIVKKEINQCTTPFIITGDFNDVPNSYTYSTIKKGLQDAFLKKGFGIGRTFSAIAPTLRIDYIFASKHFNIEQVKNEHIKLSDHYPLVCDVSLKK